MIRRSRRSRSPSSSGSRTPRNRRMVPAGCPGCRPAASRPGSVRWTSTIRRSSARWRRSTRPWCSSRSTVPVTDDRPVPSHSPMPVIDVGPCLASLKSRRSWPNVSSPATQPGISALKLLASSARWARTTSRSSGPAGSPDTTTSCISEVSVLGWMIVNQAKCPGARPTRSSRSPGARPGPCFCVLGPRSVALTSGQADSLGKPAHPGVAVARKHPVGCQVGQGIE